VWSFFAAIPGRRFPVDRAETHADFGRSPLGRQRSDYRGATAHKRSLFTKWERYEGRRVDLLMRSLSVSPRADLVAAIQDWLRQGSSHRGEKPPSSWHLAQKALVLLDPEDRRGEVIWQSTLGR
jgi:hypothetical protein